jgi:transposase
MDVHREFVQLAVLEDGLLRDEGRIGVTPEALRARADGLRRDDQVALEATGNSDAIAYLLTPLVGRVMVSDPSKTRAIAEAKVTTDKVGTLGSWRSCWLRTSCRRSGYLMSAPAHRGGR